MAKAISAVIATIMLLMITVALIGVFYVFGSNLLGSTTDTASATVSTSVNIMTKTVAVPIAKCSVSTGTVSLTIQNTGTSTISASEIGVFVNNIQQSPLSPPIPATGITPQMQFYTTTPSLGVVTSGMTKTIKVVAPAGPIQASVTCA